MTKDDANQRTGMISATEFAQVWDTERRVHELNPLTFHLRNSTMYVPARTKSDMDDVRGGPVQAVRTRTFKKEFRVWISPCDPNAPDARNLRPTTDTHGAAEFGFAIPLRKLGIRVPETRQYTFEAERIPVEDGGVVYEISFKEFQNIPRDVDPSTGKSKPVRTRKAEQATGSDNPTSSS